MEQNLNTVGETLETSVAKDDLLEVIGELSDYTIEQLINVGEHIPIISHLVKGIKATQAIRDAIFLEKVIVFLKTVGETPNEKRSKMIAKIQNDEKYRTKFGKFSIKALDRYDDDQKAKYLGMAAQYLAREEISFEFYQRFSHIIDTLTVADLESMTENTFLNFGRNTFYAFESLGLISITLKLPTESERKTAWKEDPNIIKISHRRLTDWGEAMKNILLGLPVANKL
jgi:hypothetical protein